MTSGSQRGAEGLSVPPTLIRLTWRYKTWFPVGRKAKVTDLRCVSFQAATKVCAVHTGRDRYGQSQIFITGALPLSIYRRAGLIQCPVKLPRLLLLQSCLSGLISHKQTLALGSVLGPFSTAGQGSVSNYPRRDCSDSHQYQ